MEASPILLMKARKNPTELDGLRQACVSSRTESVVFPLAMYSFAGNHILPFVCRTVLTVKITELSGS